MWYFLSCVTGFLFVVGVIARTYCRLTCGMCTCKKRMDGKTVLITGGNAGLGLESAKNIAARGARIILACRNVQSGQDAMREILQETGNSNVIVLRLDTSSLTSVREFAGHVLKTEERLDVLLLNAGIAGVNSRRVSEDGNELTMATNHLGHFLLTNLLTPLLELSAPSRVVITASDAHRQAWLDIEDIQQEKFYFRLLAYPNSKWMNILHMVELSRRLAGTGIGVFALHPGVVKTKIVWTGNVFFNMIFGGAYVQTVGKSPYEGAQTTIHTCVSPKLEGLTGKYLQDCAVYKLSKSTVDPTLARRLWELSEALTNSSSK